MKQSKHSATVIFAQPHQTRRKPDPQRKEFWERSRKRLMQGALVFMVDLSGDNGHGSCLMRDGETYHVIIGIIADRNIQELSQDEECARICVSLVDPELYVAMIDATHPSKSDQKSKQWNLVEPRADFFDNYRPILKVLQSQDPFTTPFDRYLAPTDEESNTMRFVEAKVDPPMYARAPGFQFDLSNLMEGERLTLNVNSRESVHAALHALQDCKDSGRDSIESAPRHFV
ncbi:MAG: hypothetical protein J3Q66DRAFT_21685 [Benniella sp.]|nr:MAG: hypothetical protein J3Q66DRAFT_21685 [Benniella sp.]